MNIQAHTDQPRPVPPSSGAQFWIWLRIGAQSFGGGAATLYLIRQAVVERHEWITEEAFARLWSICQITPGINILGLIILIGWQVGGASGAAAALFGLMLPSVVITMLLTALYAAIQGLAVVQAGLRGVIAATIGVSVLLALGIGRPPLMESYREGYLSLALSIAVVLTSAVLVGWFQAPVVAVLLGSGAVCALMSWWLVARKQPATDDRQPAIDE